jgi:hypothetical protein
MAYPYRLAVMALNPVAYYPLDSATAVVGNNLTLTNCAATGAPLVIGGGLSMNFVRANGPGAQATHMAAVEFLNLAPYTVVWWAQTSERQAGVIDTNRAVVGQRFNATGGWGISNGYGTPTRCNWVRDAGGSETDLQPDGMFTVGTQSFGACRYTGALMETLRNGILNSSDPSVELQGATGAQAFSIGCGQDGPGDNAYDGLLAEVAIFDYAVPTASLLNLYAAGAVGLTTQSPPTIHGRGAA